MAKKHNEVNGDEQMAEQQAISGPQKASGWQKEQVTFPPYWQPEVGKWWRGQVLWRDERALNFPRYHVKSEIPLQCRTGKVDDGEIVDVFPGEIFTLGVYARLPLDRYFGFIVEVEVMDKVELPGNEESGGVPRDNFIFELRVSPQTKKLLASQRSEDIALVIEAAKKARQLALGEEVMEAAAMTRANRRERTAGSRA